jgi:hypothetical protein
MNAPAAVPEPPYYDRSMGLVIFGVLTIGLGCLAGLFCVLILVSAAIQAATPSHPPLSSLVPGLLIYAALGAALVWLGIGSIRARRWARNLLLIFSWSWLVMGIFIVIMMAVLLPMVLSNLPQQQGHAAVPATAIWMIMAFSMVFYGFFLIVLPAIWTFFYSSRHVRGTVHWRDPEPGWTDACPLPVLGFCLWTALSALTLAAMVFMPNGVAPFFGLFLTGLAGRTFYVGMAAVWFLSAGLVYRLDVRGWWLIFAAVLVFSVSAVVTYSTHDAMELYKLMDYPQDQLDQLGKIGLFHGHFLGWITGFSILPFLGYLIFIKRYFRR